MTTKISLSQLKEVSQNIFSETMSKLLNLLSRHEYTKQIISFIRRLLIESNLDIKPKLYLKIKQALINLSNQTKIKLSHEEILYISQINTYISEKMIPSKTSSHSPLIQSFVTDLNLDSNYYTNYNPTKSLKK